MIVDRLRRAEHRALLWSLAVAAERGIPLPEAARAYADETRGSTGQRALRLALALEAGQPLSRAVRSARLRLAAPMRLAVGLGETLGVLGPAMRQQLDDSQQADAALRDTLVRFAYLTVVVLVLQGVLTFVMLKIVPVFQKMFEEFGLELPSMTQLIINVSNWFVAYGWFYVFILMVIPTAVLSLVLLIGLWKWLIDEFNEWFPSLARLGIARFAILVSIVVMFCLHVPVLLLAVALLFVGVFPRDLPLLWRLFRRYDGAMIMRGLALAVKKEVPLPRAMELVVEQYPMRYASGALSDATVRVKGGMPWPESLRQAGLIAQTDVAVLASAQRAGNLPWALEEMAESALRRTNYRLQVALQMLFPPAVLLLGMSVAFFVIGLFLPLVALIQGLT
jgi:type II secretory pathway component PulF